MALFGGVDIFGPHIQIIPVQTPRMRQVNHYPGTEGLEVIDMGSMGGRSYATGVLIAPTGLALAAAESVFRAYEFNGGAFALVDTTGTVWFNVILEAFRPEGVIMPGADAFVGNGYGRMYSAVFLHLS